MAFGDWKAVFCGLPESLRDRPGTGGIFVPIAAGLKKKKTAERLSPIVTNRNHIVHNHAELLGIPTSELVNHLHSASHLAVKTLGDLKGAGLLPTTLQPHEERRDSYGRRLLVLADADGSYTEVLVLSETDMAQPVVYLSSGSSSPDIEPTLLSAQSIDADAGLK
jgi:hypothetical protein